MPPALSHYSTTVEVGSLKAQKVWYVEEESPLLDSLVSRMISLGIQPTRVEPSTLSTRETLDNTSSPESLVLIDGNWFSQHAGENVTLSFLKSVSSHYGKLVLVGGPTSVFFDALKNAGVYDFPAGRNPANGDSQLAGFRLKVFTTPTGSYESPSLLFSNTSDLNDLLEAVNSWS